MHKVQEMQWCLGLPTTSLKCGVKWMTSNIACCRRPLAVSLLLLPFDDIMQHKGWVTKSNAQLAARLVTYLLCSLPLSSLRPLLGRLPITLDCSSCCNATHVGEEVIVLLSNRVIVWQSGLHSVAAEAVDCGKDPRVAIPRGCLEEGNRRY